MSLTGAMTSAISGLNSQSQALAMVSDNLANASTTGYKTTNGMFEDMVTNSSSAKEYSSGGVSVYGFANIAQQGLLATTTTATNVAIQGQGFFVVNSSPSGSGTTSYTRNGAFTVDNAGYLENNGSYLMGWPTDSSGNVSAGGTLQPINTEIAAVSGAATTETTMALNLPADATAGGSFTSSMSVYDSLGNSSTIQVTWTKSATATDTWTASFGNPTATNNPSQQTGTISSGSPLTVVFNSDGSLKTINGSAPSTTSPVTLGIGSWTTGAANSSIALNLGTAGGTNGLTQYASGQTTPAISITGVNSNGLAFGKLSSVSIGSNGVVNATYSNGQTVPIYKIPVATFMAPDQLAAQSNGLYESTVGSGNATLQASGTNGAGTVYGSELESSTTDTNGQFSVMMSAQQAYSASAQVITAVNKMFDTLISSLR
ncbi:flagellar hook protein FlgE [Bradyrhizobium sp. U87765 SZCCT0131]|uniref:flagellar hook protein FlgE n=1 Tax=unclassified Bradyrhizobium TaxID=2631580 RepID=UPI001BA8789B|nr:MULTISPECIES: flagellar hook protein FlgE [unclassified Bradyrhizobium]MBR1220952.1 flagellar hook protein FlgE [Bradyrhizobium sp. U87765 SZCCT0131]MBR1260228.1 flagellar hook protein FlgE [Bradyrhizobium sp. U87765 SZCCT0134]MBR1307523.1 flagellar hook protein FlgE [Bradyrhizobium sp. U87765 SZCCT0110]MBR1321477.1 flagellar hook protein FlgE [Bradyrhizobium sp. U87765 SZCCT0109]MBR1349790.1 flagellar hook protein FlgE [Bradyrhizobium sp. U87765 SZCCT0048]